MATDPQPSPSFQVPDPRIPNPQSDNGPDDLIDPALVEAMKRRHSLPAAAAPGSIGARGRLRFRLSHLPPQRLLLEAIAVVAVSLLIISLAIETAWLGIPAALLTLILALRSLWHPLHRWLQEWFSPRYQSSLLAVFTALVALVALANFTGTTERINLWIAQINWDAAGALAEGFGALGQILVAYLALRLTIQQNRITQQQTIDAYFQGVSDLILNEEGLLEDWPSERAIAEGRTAAILSGLNAEGKAKVLRFLSSSKLLTPLKRDRRLGRPIFNGLGGYEEDIEYGIRVIDLGNILVGADLAATDLRNTDLSEANLSEVNLNSCDLSRTNLSRTILQDADLANANLSRARLFYGALETASPRDRIVPPNYNTGAHTGAVIENADFTNVWGLSEEQRYYCCAWGGSLTRETIPGGCAGIPNKLEDADIKPSQPQK